MTAACINLHDLPVISQAKAEHGPRGRNPQSFAFSLTPASEEHGVKLRSKDDLSLVSHLSFGESANDK
jgi:hypothetical protein